LLWWWGGWGGAPPVALGGGRGRAAGGTNLFRTKTMSFRGGGWGAGDFSAPPPT